MSCPDCFRGHDHHGTPTGVEKELYGLQTYVTAPPAEAVKKSDGAVIIFSDAFGWNTVNLRLVADTYARRIGCTVYLPDFMYGTATPAWVKGNIDRIISERGLWGWLVKPLLVVQAAWHLIPFSLRNSPPKRYALQQQYVSDFRAAHPTQTRLGGVGFCWGAYGVTHLASAHDQQPRLDVGYTAHPSEVTVEDFRSVRVPFGVVVGDVDFALKIEQVRELEQVLAENQAVETEVVVIPHARHGFAVRGSPDDPVEKEMADRAEDQVVGWFVKHL